MVKRLAVAVLGLVPVAGCVLFSDFSGLTGGPGADAGTDAAPVDAAAAADTGTDAGFTCEGALFCDRFETGTVTPTWTRTFESPGAVIRVEPSATLPSAGGVLLTSTSPTSATTYAYLSRELLPAARRVSSATLSFAVMPEHVETVARASIAAIILGEGTGNEYAVRVVLDGNRAVIEERTPARNGEHVFSEALTVGRWSRLSFGAGRGRITARIDDRSVVDAPAIAAAPTSDQLPSSPPSGTSDHCSSSDRIP